MLTLRPISCSCSRVAKLVVTAAGVGLLTGFFGVGGGFALVPAHLDWALIGAFTGVAVAGSLIGGRITSRVNPRHLTGAFALILGAVALFIAARSIPALV